LEKEKLDFWVDDDEETEETTEKIAEKDPERGISQEIQGLDDDPSPIERLHAPILAHEAALTDKRVHSDVEDHPDGHKSTKQQAKMEREIVRGQTMNRSHEVRNVWVDKSPRPKISQNPPRAQSRARDTWRQWIDVLPDESV
jgi:hypothetical protein